MKHGDFSSLAQAYINRPGYSSTVLKMLAQHVGVLDSKDKGPLVADVGAGTGKLTENLLELGLHCVAVEPNDSMRAEGIKYTSKFKVEWKKGSGEETGLPANSVRWVLMGSSFHWVDFKRGLEEFHRILKPDGYFTALWNPRDIASSELHTRIENRIYEIIPKIERVSSGSSSFTQDLLQKLPSTGHFVDPIFIEATHSVIMSKDRYLGAWRSVNDIAVQAGPDKFEVIMKAIEEEISDLKEVTVPYKTRAWSARRA